MNIKLLHITKPRWIIQLKISDCWTIDNIPIRWQLEPLENLEYPDWSGYRIIFLWFAFWFVHRTEAGQ